MTVTALREDFDLLKQWYDIKAVNIEQNSLYPYGIDPNEEPPHESHAPYTIWLGNSASKTNNHIDALYKLSGVQNSIKRIYCSLSYGGGKRYTKHVIQTGKNLFGDKFYPLLDFIPKNEYFAMMREADIGVFNYNRQEGLGNIWGLMLKGKTIYIKHNTTTQMFFNRHGIKTYDIEKINEQKIEVMDMQILCENTKCLKDILDERKSVELWKQILSNE